MKKLQPVIEWKQTAQLEVVNIDANYGKKIVRIATFFTFLTIILSYNIPYLYLFVYFISSLIKGNNLVVANFFINGWLISLVVVCLASYITSLVLSIISIRYAKVGIKHLVNTTKTLKLGKLDLILSTCFICLMIIYLVVYLIIAF